MFVCIVFSSLILSCNTSPIEYHMIPTRSLARPYTIHPCIHSFVCLHHLPDTASLPFPQVAVKVLSAVCQRNLPAQVLLAFEDEVSMLARLRHPNIWYDTTTMTLR